MTAAAGSDSGTPSLHQMLYSSVGAVRLQDLGLMTVIVLGPLWVSDGLGVALAPIPSVLFLTTIALIFAELPVVRTLQGAGVIGNYLVLIFLARNGAMSVIANIVVIGPPIVYYTLITVSVHGLIIFGIGRLVGLDLKTLAVTSQANVGGPASAMALATARGYTDRLLPGVAVGLLGYAPAISRVRRRGGDTGIDRWLSSDSQLALSLLLAHEEGRKVVLQLLGQRSGLKRVSRRAHEHLVSGDGELARPEVEHIEVDLKGARPEAGEVRRDPELVVEPRRVVEARLEMDAREPHVESIENIAVRDARGAEKLHLGDLEEPDVRSVEDDPGLVDRGPTDAFVYGEELLPHGVSGSGTCTLTPASPPASGRPS